MGCYVRLAYSDSTELPLELMTSTSSVESSRVLAEVPPARARSRENAQTADPSQSGQQRIHSWFSGLELRLRWVSSVIDGVRARSGLQLNSRIW